MNRAALHYRYIFSIIIAVILLFSVITDWYVLLTYALMLTLLSMVLYRIGKGIVLLEVIAFMYTLTCLLMPIVGYEFYSSTNQLSKLWIRFMPITRESYFGYALPAITLFCLVLTLPRLKREQLDEGKMMGNMFQRARAVLDRNRTMGFWILGIGTFVSLFINLLPSALSYIATLVFLSSFAGLLYIYFTPKFRFKYVLLVGFALFIFANSLQTGMFTIVAYMGVTIFSFFQFGKKISMLRKFGYLVFAVAFFLVLQNVKIAFRKTTWGKEFSGSRTELFSNLVVSNVQKGDALISRDAFFPLYLRMNQGYNVALVIRRFPDIVPHDYGGHLAVVAASAFVPRIFWPDKPEAGGRYNMKFYTGWVIKSWSTNVGPLGEAFGSFGAVGGIFYMALLAFFIRFVYMRMLRIAWSMPLLICWIPVVFYQVSLSSETDTLEILNSVIKSSFFVWLLYKAYPTWFLGSRSRGTKRPVA